MLEVLVHRSFLVIGSRSFVLFLAAFFALLPHLVTGQTINGQTFTNGLTIIDAPSASKPGNAGSTISIVVDVSGNGKLQSVASLPGSGLSTSYESLEIYLVSAQTNINMTVSSGPAFLSGESGSTVKHLGWPIPACIPEGNYNLTFYETSHFEGQGVFTITSIPIPISNSGPSTQCPSDNPVQPQPQDSNPLSQSPFAPKSGNTASASRSGMVTIIGAGPSPTMTITLTVSGGALELPTVTATVTAKATPTTVVLVSLSTVTETDQGKVTTYTQTSTITTVVAAGQTPVGQPDTGGFIPVNAGFRLAPSIMSLFLFSWTLTLYLLMSMY